VNLNLEIERRPWHVRFAPNSGHWISGLRMFAKRQKPTSREPSNGTRCGFECRAGVYVRSARNTKRSAIGATNGYQHASHHCSRHSAAWWRRLVRPRTLVLNEVFRDQHCGMLLVDDTTLALGLFADNFRCEREPAAKLISLGFFLPYAGGCFSLVTSSTRSRLSVARFVGAGSISAVL
jgi:hypothetical protein